MVKIGIGVSMGSKPKRISASRVSKLLGLNKYENGSVVDLWLELMHEEYPGWLQKNGYKYNPIDISEKPEIKLGLMFEGPIFNYLSKTLIDIIPNSRELFFQNNTLSCHLDFQYRRNDTIENAEIKTTNSFTYYKDFGDNETDQVPDNYYVQVQQQMGLSGVKRTFMPVLVFPNRQVDVFKNFEHLPCNKLIDIVENMALLGLLKFHYINFDQQVFDVIKEKSEKFWKEHMLTKTPPEPDNLEDYKKICKPIFGELKMNAESESYVHSYFGVKETCEHYASKADEYRHKIIKYMQEKGTPGRSNKLRLLYPDGKVAATYNHKTGSFSIRKKKDKDGI